MKKELHIFDFDGTLFDSPIDTEENRSFYTKETGIPWVIDEKLAEKLSEEKGTKFRTRKGWYGRVETLQPPLVPDPAPQSMWIEETVNQFFQSKNDPNSTTVIMTGRHSGIQGAVLRILMDGGLVNVLKKGEKYLQSDPNVNCLFRGQTGPAVKARPMPNEDTISWKLWIIEKYTDMIPFKKLVVWEDREEHVATFKELNDILDLEVVVNHVQIKT